MIPKSQNRQRWRGLLYTKPAIFLLLLLVIALGRSVYLIWHRERVADNERQAILEQIEAMETRQAQLTTDLTLLQTDRGVEERIRQQFSVAKAGEQVVSVVLLPASTSTPIKSTLPWWQPLLDLFN